MFSNKAKSIADACRFCWMCRHICPVGLVTGCEGNTPRARGLLISMDSRSIPLKADSTELMYQCSLCGACTNDCATGYDPRVFTREARTNAIISDMVPQHIQNVIDRAMAGDVCSGPKAASLAAVVKELPQKADVLLYLGETAWHEGATAAAVIKLMKKAGVSFTVMQEEPSCGSYLGDLIGFVDEVRQTAVRCFDSMKATGASKVVVLDPSCMTFFRHQCAEWDILPELSFQTATSFCAELITEGRLKPKALGGKATYHDPCHLARDLDEVQPARDIIAAMGITLEEMFLNRRMSKCCGGEVMRETNPDITEKMAAARWSDAATLDVDTMITACPGCAYILGANVPDGMRQVDLFELLAEACE